MCLIVIAIGQHPHYPLIVAANRDELHARPSAPAAVWPDSPGLVAGRDLEAGGTWLGMTCNGRFAAITNYRQREPVNGNRSRGLLVTDFLLGDDDPAAFAETLRATRADYRPYNLLFGNADGLHCYSSPTDGLQALTRGLYALSNHLLDTPWPKAERAKRAVTAILEKEPDASGLRSALFGMMRDETPADPAQPPETGLDRPLELALSSIFIHTPQYGTRSTTVLLVDRDRLIDFSERSFDADGEAGKQCRFRCAMALDSKSNRNRPAGDYPWQ